MQYLLGGKLSEELLEQINKLKTNLKEVRKENKELKREMAKMLKYTWYKIEE